ncbi:TPA: hypothetical protein N0F65_007823 [Lagenidium giganteum]|uniref:TAZ-type domain-containing protein n=1 Tax=Lagenidium giganteum TaxID=4803 RepID=A0AAV2Z4B2_9STRA|nr:TPA: hypothetical protein N0F65_007823 [Lagenidium giganteum]
MTAVARWNNAAHDSNDAALRPATTGRGGAGAASAGLLKRQWEAKLVSFQRGMEHVEHCRHGCDSALCQSTRRLVHTYETHQCPNARDCKVCKLWKFMMEAKSTTRIGTSTSTSDVRSIDRTNGTIGSRVGGGGVFRASCHGAASKAMAHRSAAIAYLRIVAAEKEALATSRQA